MLLIYKLMRFDTLIGGHKILMKDCRHHHSLPRRHFTIGALSAISLLGSFAFAQSTNKPAVLSGKLDIDSFKNNFAVRALEKQTVFQIGNDAFLADEAFEGTFETDSNGVLSQLSVASGQLLSVLAPLSGRSTTLQLPNATGSIRGTGFYANVSLSTSHDYLCCCYGKIHFPETPSGDKQALETRYHHAVVIDQAGQFGVPEYTVPFGHYDDELQMLERQVGRTPHWQLPDNKRQFLSPTPQPHP